MAENKGSHLADNLFSELHWVAEGGRRGECSGREGHHPQHAPQLQEQGASHRGNRLIFYIVLIQDYLALQYSETRISGFQQEIRLRKSYRGLSHQLIIVNNSFLSFTQKIQICVMSNVYESKKGLPTNQQFWICLDHFALTLGFEI